MRITLVVLFLLLSSAAFAQEPPFDFKGIALGSGISAVESNAKFLCYEPKPALADKICSLKLGEKETIAGASVRSLMFFYYSGKLGIISIEFDEKNFSQVTDALVEKYGQGLSWTERVRNRMGTTFENKIYMWPRNATYLTVDRYSSELSTSSVRYITDFAAQELSKREKKARAKDL